MSGKQLRSRRLFSFPEKRTIIVPLDHTLSMGMIEGLEDLAHVIHTVRSNGCDGVILHKGTLERLIRLHGASLFDDLVVVVHLSGATSLSPTPSRQTLLCDVDEALELGADWVSVQVNFGCQGDSDMIQSLGAVTRNARRWGVPVLAMTYVRDDHAQVGQNPEAICHAARVAADLGADAVKIPFIPAHVLQELTRIVLSPVVLGGGARSDEQSFIERVRTSMLAGAAGLCVGRNVFQAENPGVFLRALVDAVHSPQSEPRLDKHLLPMDQYNLAK